MKKKVLLISPHPDDIELSLGCSMNRNSERFEVCIWDVFTQKKYNKIEKDFSEVIQIVKDEEFDVWKNREVHIIYDNFVDAQLRHNCRASQLMGNGSLFKGLKEERQLYKELKNSFCNLIQEVKPDYVGVPMGIGRHIDHLIVREMVLSIAGQYQIFFYEDMPYSMNKKWYEEVRQEIIQSMDVIEFTFFFSANEVKKKMRIVQKYKSQFTKHELSMIERFELSKMCEKVWMLKKNKEDELK